MGFILLLKEHRPPDGGRLPARSLDINIALLTEGRLLIVPAESLPFDSRRCPDSPL